MNKTFLQYLFFSTRSFNNRKGRHWFCGHTNLNQNYDAPPRYQSFVCIVFAFNINIMKAGCLFITSRRSVLLNIQNLEKTELETAHTITKLTSTWPLTPIRTVFHPLLSMG